MTTEEQKTIDEERIAKQDQLADDFRATFTKFDSGIRVYRYLESFCYKFNQTSVKDSPDESTFNAGIRAVILEIDRQMALVNKKPKQETAEN